MFGAPYEVEIPEAEGGHGGGDPVLLNDLFGPPRRIRFNRAASHVDGAMSILTGIAANISMRTGQPVKIDDLVGSSVCSWVRSTAAAPSLNSENTAVQERGKTHTRALSLLPITSGRQEKGVGG